MSNRTVTQRNLLGGFLGGMLGTLAFGWLHPAWMPVGCLLGVVLGWWYEAIGQAIAQSVGNPRTFLSAKTNWITPMQTYCRSLLYRIYYKTPSLKEQWRTMMLTSSACLFLIEFACIVPLIQALGEMPGVPLGVGMISMLILTSVIQMTNASTMRGSTIHALQYRFFRRHGKILGAFKVSWDMLGMQICCVQIIIICIGIVVSSVAYALPLLAFCVVLAVAIGLLRGLYATATRGGHWLCFCVTLIVTAICTTQTPTNTLGDPYALVMSGLVTGVLSGLATEAVRRVLALLLEPTYIRSFCNVPLMDRVVSCWESHRAMRRWMSRPFYSM